MLFKPINTQDYWIAVDVESVELDLFSVVANVLLHDLGLLCKVKWMSIHY